MKKRVGLYLSAEPYGGGVFQFNLAMIEAVTSLSQYEVVIAYSLPIWSKYLSDYNAKQLYIEDTPSFTTRALWKIWRELKLPLGWWRRINHMFHPITSHLVQEKCDLWIFPSLDELTYQVNAPVLATVHDLMHRYETFPEVSDKKVYEWREYLFTNMFAMAKGSLVDSEVGKTQVIESYGAKPEQIHVLPYIPPQYIYQPASNYRGDLPDKFIFYPAQFWEHKNHKRLIKAIALLVDNLPDIQLVLVGSTKNGYESAKNLVKELHLENRVHFLGYVADNQIVDIYRRARAMVMPTFFGPTNIPPLEGFALGCPVAVSNIYAMPEQVGDAALLFDPYSEQEIAAVIERLWVDDKLCETLRSNGLAKSNSWGQREFSTKLHEIVERVLSTET